MNAGTEPIVVVALPAPPDAETLARLQRDPVRLTAAERRWPRRRVTTAGGRVLALALSGGAGAPVGAALAPGCVLHVGPDWYACLEAALEPVLAITPRSAPERIRVALEVGSQHAALAVDGDGLLVPDEPALERLLRRLDVPWTRARRPFAPVATGTPHRAGD